MSGGTTGQVLSEKILKYGVLGASVIPDSMATIKAAQDKAEEATKAKEPCLPQTKEELLLLLKEVGEEQAEVQRQSLQLINELVGTTNLTLSGVLLEVQKLNLNPLPLERLGISESEMHKLLEPYMEDKEVQQMVEKCETKSGLGSMDRVKKIKFKTLVDIHEFMALKLKKVCEDVAALGDAERTALTPRVLEVAAEVLVGIQVEKRFKVKNEDIELAIEVNEESLAKNERFRKVQEELQIRMSTMMNSLKPPEARRAERDDFIGKVRRVAAIQKSTKQFMESARRELVSGDKSYHESYEGILELTAQNPDKDVDIIELRLLYDTRYRERDAEIDELWAGSRLDFQSFMTALMFAQGNPNAPMFPLPPVPPSQFGTERIVEMQEGMVQFLQSHIEKVVELPERKEWKPDLALALVQGLASADFEAQFQLTAEDMTIASFDRMQELQTNERFMQASMQQQQILQHIPEILSSDAKADGCSVQ